VFRRVALDTPGLRRSGQLPANLAASGFLATSANRLSFLESLLQLDIINVSYTEDIKPRYSLKLKRNGAVRTNHKKLCIYP